MCAGWGLCVGYKVEILGGVIRSVNGDVYIHWVLKVESYTLNFLEQCWLKENFLAWCSSVWLSTFEY